MKPNENICLFWKCLFWKFRQRKCFAPAFFLYFFTQPFCFHFATAIMFRNTQSESRSIRGTGCPRCQTPTLRPSFPIRSSRPPQAFFRNLAVSLQAPRFDISLCRTSITRRTWTFSSIANSPAFFLSRFFHTPFLPFRPPLPPTKSRARCRVQYTFFRPVPP